MKKLALIFITLIFILLSCKNETNINRFNKKNITMSVNDEGFLLLTNKCFVCHNPDLDCGERVAPPMFKVKDHYIDDETTKAEFIDEIVSFVKNPSEDMSYMPGALNNFGLMPKINFNENDLKKIADYIYKTDLSNDKWFVMWENYKNKSILKSDSKINYLKEGQIAASKTKAILAKNLIGAMSSKGVDNALEFCSNKAIFLTDSMSTVLNTKVKRVSDKPRNNINKANDDENAIIQSFILAKKNQNNIIPKAVEKSNKVFVYIPIETNSMCLKCHGTLKKELEIKTYNKITSLYPNDKAIAYSENEIRGLFVVEMNKR